MVELKRAYKNLIPRENCIMGEELIRLRNIIEKMEPDESKMRVEDRHLLNMIDEVLEGGEEMGLCMAQQFRYRKVPEPVIRDPKTGKFVGYQ